MTLKEFVRRCMSEHLPASIYDANAQDDTHAFILGVTRLADINGLVIENCEVEAFSIMTANNGTLRWMIMVK